MKKQVYGPDKLTGRYSILPASTLTPPVPHTFKGS